MKFTSKKISNSLIFLFDNKVDFNMFKFFAFSHIFFIYFKQFSCPLVNVLSPCYHFVCEINRIKVLT